MTLLQRA